MKLKKFKINIICIILTFMVILSTNQSYAANNAWSAQSISNFLFNKIDAPSILNDDKYIFAITRAEFCELVVSFYAKVNNTKKENIIVEKNIFTDTVNIDVQRAYSLGLVQGINKNTFDPDTNLTKEQLATILTRLLEIKNISTDSTNDLHSFIDKGNVSPWAYSSLAYCVDNQIIESYQSQLQPKESAITEQAITMLDRIALQNNWIMKSNDKYVFGFLLPNDTEIDFDFLALNEFELIINCNKNKNIEKIKDDLNYMLHSKFKDDVTINEIVDRAVDTITGLSVKDKPKQHSMMIYYIEDYYINIQIYGDDVRIDIIDEYGIEVPPIPEFGV